MPDPGAAALGRVHKILLIRLRSLGDAVLMTPVPLALKAWRPSAQVSVLIEEPFAGVFRNQPAVEEILEIAPRSRASERLRLLAQIRRRRFDLVINMHSGPTAGFFTAFSGAPHRVSYASARYAAWSNMRVPDSRTFWSAAHVHTVEHQLSPLLHLGIPVPEKIELDVRLAPEAERRVEQQIAALDVRSGQFILLHPFATLFTKEWDLKRFAELARRLRESYGLPILATAGPAERDRLNQLLSLSSGAVTGLPAMLLEDLTVWIDRCGLYVGNDSGPTHLAAARKKKLVVLWGSSDYHAWHPWGTTYQLLRADLPCIPCPGYRCDQFDSPRCIESISVEHVLHAVKRLDPFV